MKKIKVYLQYPWKFPDSPYYKYLVDSPPEGIGFLNVEKQKGVIVNKRFFWFSNFLKRNIRRGVGMLRLSIPNAHLSPSGDYDLIHCAHCLSKNKDKPWVADIEMLGSLALYFDEGEKALNKVRAYLESDNCKRILPWTEVVRDELIRVFPSIKDKIELLYPAVSEVKDLHKLKNKKVRVIFVARYFDIKGGLIALGVLEELRKKYNIDGIVVSNVPERFRKKYSKLKIYNLMSQKKLFKLMEGADLFLYPGSVDTFGFSLLEAMAFGLPIITINTNGTASRKEIVENNKTGFIFDVKGQLAFDKIGRAEEFVLEKLVGNCGRLIEDKKLRNKMSKNCLRVIHDGKFSVKMRNKKLGKIYRDALG